MFVPEPTATHLVPFHATPAPAVVNILFPFAELVHVIPSAEYATVLFPVLLLLPYLLET